MGVKEESLPVRYVFGFSGQTRPQQMDAGPCVVCQCAVWVDGKRASRAYRSQQPVHYGCQTKDHRS